MQFQLPRMEISCKEGCLAKHVPLCRNIAGSYSELQGRSQWPGFGSLCNWLMGTVILRYYSLEFTTLKLQIPHGLFPAFYSKDRSHIAASSRLAFYKIICFRDEETGKKVTKTFSGRKNCISFSLFHAKENIRICNWRGPLQRSTPALLCSHAHTCVHVPTHTCPYACTHMYTHSSLAMVVCPFKP